MNVYRIGGLGFVAVQKHSVIRMNNVIAVVAVAAATDQKYFNI